MIYTTTTASKVEELRAEFDSSYAIPSSSQVAEQTENLLAIRVAGDPYAIRVSEISGLANNRKIVPLPSPIHELLGVASVRGGFLPVYSLDALLGYRPCVDPPPRWLALCGAEEPAGLAFGEFENYLRISFANLHAAEQERKDTVHQHVKHVVRAAGVVRAVVGIPYLVEAIRRLCNEKPISKER